MKIKAFVEEFDHCRTRHSRTPFVEQLFPEHLLVNISRDSCFYKIIDNLNQQILGDVWSLHDL